MIAKLKTETEAAIRARAHQIWEDEGRPEGRHEDHWQRAYEAIVDVAPVSPPKKTPSKEAPAGKTEQAKTTRKK